MTEFESKLIDNGYLLYTFDCKSGTYKEKKDYFISTMVNLNHRYIHKSNEKLFGKIRSGDRITNESFSSIDRDGEICFGLSEQGKPPTLMYPRPRIEIRRLVDGVVVKTNEAFDDSMNIVLQLISFDDIYEAMFDKNIIIKIDYTDGSET